MDESRPLTERERALVRAARDKAFILYEGEQTPHRSCGIALAETFGLATPAYQSLRRGGITGCGTCGAVRAGEQILGEMLGDPDPTGQVTDALRRAVIWYQAQVAQKVDIGSSPDLVCNNLTRKFKDFHSPERAGFCTSLAAQLAGLTAEALVRFAPEHVTIEIAPIAGVQVAPDAKDRP